MKFTGRDGVVTRVICGYSPCSNKKKDSGTVYQQHQWHHINKLNVLTCPREWFHKNLLQQMKQWQAAGEHLVLCLDANENIYRAKLGWQLTDLHGLGMKEVVREFTGRQLGATFFRGSEPCCAHRNNLYGYRGQVQIYGIKDTHIQSTYIQITYIVLGDHQNAYIQIHF
jgi:hypothetical protein